MRRWLSIVAVALTMVACSERPVGAAVTDTPRGEWLAGARVEVRYENCDTLSLYDVAVVVRREASATEVAMPLRVRCTSPSGVTFESGVVVPEESHRGGSFTESVGAWIEDAHFAESGEYLFTFTPESDLRGVWSVGVELKVEN